MSQQVFIDEKDALANFYCFTDASLKLIGTTVFHEFETVRIIAEMIKVISNIY
jgi:hypothetical protein